MVHKELRREQQDNTIIPKAEFKWGCGNFSKERKRERYIERGREREKDREKRKKNKWK